MKQGRSTLATIDHALRKSCTVTPFTLTLVQLKAGTLVILKSTIYPLHQEGSPTLSTENSYCPSWFQSARTCCSSKLEKRLSGSGCTEGKCCLECDDDDEDDEESDAPCPFLDTRGLLAGVDFFFPICSMSSHCSTEGTSRNQSLLLEMSALIRIRGYHGCSLSSPYTCLAALHLD
eukprot:1161844-Pelagomonas_calceolata.AAC.4